MRAREWTSKSRTTKRTFTPTDDEPLASTAKATPNHVLPLQDPFVAANNLTSIGSIRADDEHAATIHIYKHLSTRGIKPDTRDLVLHLPLADLPSCRQIIEHDLAVQRRSDEPLTITRDRTVCDSERMRMVPAFLVEWRVAPRKDFVVAHYCTTRR